MNQKQLNKIRRENLQAECEGLFRDLTGNGKRIVVLKVALLTTLKLLNMGKYIRDERMLEQSHELLFKKWKRKFLIKI